MSPWGPAPAGPFSGEARMSSEQEWRVAIITGGAYGIGRAVARVFAAHGDRVLVADVDERRGRDTEAQILDDGGCAAFLRTDVRSEAEISAMISTAVQRWGRLDVLCNNAGVERDRRADEYTLDDWNLMVDTNFRAAFLASKSAFPFLRRTRGSIVNISSVQGIANTPNCSIYAGTKAGILGLTRGMAVDFAEFGVRVNAVCPGPVNTGMMESYLAGQPDPAAELGAMIRSVPLHRIAEPAEIAAAVWFLASAEAAYITGVALPVDGGCLAKLSA
jgi:NAD(P)-dependent dehydrogenase (short-subunit alcohol dehydrogenase family)